MKTKAIVVMDLAVGTAVGIVLHYYLYRVGLPIVPFIYQAF